MDLDLLESGKYHRCMIVMGLLPCSTKKDKLKIQKIYNILLLVFFIGVSVYGIHDIHQCLDTENELIISLLVMTLCFISDIGTLMVILIEVLVTLERQIEFIRKTRQIYIKLRDKTGYRICGGAFGAWLRRKYGCIGAVLVGGIIAYILIICFTYYFGFFWYSMTMILIIRSRFLKMSLYIDILRNYLNVVNHQLQQILDRTESPIFLRHNITALNSLEHLLILKEIYTDIAECVELYNNIFGWSTISIVICAYLGITVHIYWFFLTWDGFYHHLFIYTDLSMLIPITTILWIFSYNCEQLHRNDCRTASLVQKLIGTMKLPYNSVAYEFLLQTYNKPLNVSAKGFFQADMGMLMGVGAYIVSMLVILVQFSEAEFDDRGYHRIKNFTNKVS